MPTNLPSGYNPPRQQTGTLYASHAWAARLISLVKVWSSEGREERFVPSRANGMAPNTMRAAFYTARSFINDPANGYDADTINLVNSVRFALTDHPSEGLILRSTTPMEMVSAPAKPPDAENDTLQEIVAWCGAPHANGDANEWRGMFSVALRQRVEAFMRQLVGAYLARITPTSIKIIAWEDGAAAEPAAPVVNNTPPADEHF